MLEAGLYELGEQSQEDIRRPAVYLALELDHEPLEPVVRQGRRGAGRGTTEVRETAAGTPHDQGGGDVDGARHRLAAKQPEDELDRAPAHLVEGRVHGGQGQCGGAVVGTDRDRPAGVLGLLATTVEPQVVGTELQSVVESCGCDLRVRP